MTEHYYTQSPQSAHDEHTIRFEVLGESLECLTDAGVFSRGDLDEGTRILLEALPDMRGRVLDLCCGWGPVGAALGKKYPEISLVLTDVNERATALASRNLALNGVSAEAVLTGDALEAVEGRFDFIVLNPPIRAGKAVIYPLFASAAQHLTEDGELYIVIRKQQGAESAQKYLLTVFDDVERVAREKGYWVLRCRGVREEKA